MGFKLSSSIKFLTARCTSRGALAPHHGLVVTVVQREGNKAEKHYNYCNSGVFMRCLMNAQGPLM